MWFGVLEGTDANLKKTNIVIYSAHYDHMVLANPDALKGDSIY